MWVTVPYGEGLGPANEGAGGARDAVSQPAGEAIWNLVGSEPVTLHFAGSEKIYLFRFFRCWYRFYIRFKLDPYLGVTQ